ncbi:MAG: multidrug efflux protein, partial [Alphaproteobacteria bacterium]
VLTTILEAAVIVIVVIFLFLGNPRATVIPVVTIPLSLIGVLFLLQALGYSINLLTLLALVMAIGLVVDDAIVVVENISRHIEEGMGRRAAAILGAREIALPVIAMTITLAAVYAPIGFVGGLTGQLFREFAFTLAAAVVISGVVALTLSPMMCSRLLLRRENEGRLALFLEARLRNLGRAYAAALKGALAMRPALLALTVMIIATCGVLYVSTQKELAPTEDQGFLFTVNQAPEWTNVDYLETYTLEQYKFFAALPEFDGSFLVNGAAGPSGGFAGLILKDREDRARGDQDVIAELQPKLASLSGIRSLMFMVPTLPGSSGGPPVQFVVQTLDDPRVLYEALLELKARADASGLFIFTNTDLAFEKPQINVKIDRT